MSKIKYFLIIFFLELSSVCFADNLLLKQQMEQDCEKNNMESCYKLGNYYSEEEKNDLKAMTFHEKACNQNHLFACNNLAFLYLQGEGVQHDHKKAETMFEKLCIKHKDKSSCNNLGTIYLNKKEYKKAKKFLTEACKNNSIGGCNNLALIYYDGLGTKQDLNLAKEYYKKSCELSENELIIACNHYKELENK